MPVFYETESESLSGNASGGSRSLVFRSTIALRLPNVLASETEEDCSSDPDTCGFPGYPDCCEGTHAPGSPGTEIIFEYSTAGWGSSIDVENAGGDSFYDPPWLQAPPTPPGLGPTGGADDTPPDPWEGIEFWDLIFPGSCRTCSEFDDPLRTCYLGEVTAIPCLLATDTRGYPTGRLKLLNRPKPCVVRTQCVNYWGEAG